MTETGPTRSIDPTPTPPPLHPDLAPLAGLLGEWQGRGRGVYPTIESFDYLETLRFTHTGKPFLAYVQASRRPDGGPALHAESGYLRPAGAGRVEMVVAQPTGIVEVDEGRLDADGAGLAIRVVSRTVGNSSTAKQVTAVERSYRVDGDVLETTLAMAAVGQPLTHHLSSRLRRMGPP